MLKRLTKERGTYMNALIAFCSLTGNNEDISEIITDNLSDDFECTEIEMENVTESQIKESDLIVCVSCTHDGLHDGLPVPDEAVSFYNLLHNQESLENKSYLCAGSGDKFYEDDYCYAVKAFDKLLKDKSARKVGPNIYIDQYVEDSDEDLILNTISEINNLQQ